MVRCFLRLLILVFIGNLALVAPVTADELVRVKLVSDGDSIILEDGRRVRYLGINAPEFQEPFYLKAKRFNESLVLGQKVRLEFGQERGDTYGRVLAYVYVGDVMVNARLVQEGLAHAFFIGPDRKHNAMLLRFQAEAKQRKVGIWSARGRARDLKITSIHPGNPDNSDLDTSYVRIANLSDELMHLTGYVLKNESGKRFVFPDVAIEPGYTVIVAGKDGTNGIDRRGQVVVHWPIQDTVWDQKEDTAYLMDPAGVIVDTFHYRGKRVTKSPLHSPEEISGKIIGNRSSKIYHLPGQTSYDRIKEENRVYFDTEEDAIRAGYRRAKR